MGTQWLSGRVLDSRPRGRGFEPHRRHCVVSLSKNINPILVLVQPSKTRPFITERLLMGRKESNQTNKNKLNNDSFLPLPKGVLSLENSAESDEMQHYVAFQLGHHCLPMYPLRVLQNTWVSSSLHAGLFCMLILSSADFFQSYRY